MERAFSFSAHARNGEFLYHCTSTDFFHILQNIIWNRKYIPMRIWPYASSSLHVTDLETMYLSRLSEYGTEENLDWIYAIWFWPVLHLNLLSCSCFPFVFFICSVFVFFFFLSPLSSRAVFVTFCVEVGSLFAWFFYSVRATKRSIQIVFYVTRGKTSDRCLFCFSG